MAEAKIRQSMRELRELYTNLFILMESSISLSPSDPKSEENLVNMNADIATRMQLVDHHMRRFLQDLDPWRDRDDISDDLRGEVNEFIGALDQGLNAMESKVRARADSVQDKKTQLGDAIRRLQKNRHGMRKYHSGPQGSRLLDSEI